MSNAQSSAKPAAFVLHTVRAAPAEYRSLIWDEFFVSRGRGLSLGQHFPWIEEESPDVLYVAAYHGDICVGGLALRKDEIEGRSIGTIGLVCVAPDFRGKGISTQLLTSALAESRASRLDAVRLWTQKPGVYVNHGFVSADTSLFGIASRLEPGDIHHSKPLTITPVSDRGVPPFATSVTRWDSSEASITTIEDARGSILAEWSGALDAVIALIDRVFRTSFRMNAVEDHPILLALRRGGWDLDLAPSQLQMILPLGRGVSAQALASQIPGSVLSRI